MTLIQNPAIVNTMMSRLFFLIIQVVWVTLLFPSFSTVAGQWPDTGQTDSYTQTPGEDSDYRGLPHSYTKLGYGGEVLSETAQISDGWIMTQDNVTGLIWEIKTKDNSIHDFNKTFTWCDTNPDTNYGHQGTCTDGGDTEDFIEAVNSEKFGGYSDWRLPTEKELATLIDSSRAYPAINTTFFPNTVSDGYWTAIPSVYLNDHAWRVEFGDGSVRYGLYKYFDFYVRAVRTPIE